MMEASRFGRGASVCVVGRPLCSGRPVVVDGPAGPAGPARFVGVAR